MDCSSWTWFPLLLLLNIPGWPLKAGFLLGFSRLQPKTDLSTIRKLMFENLGRVLLNPWNGFHHDLLLLPGAASTRRGATFSFLCRAALLSPHQGGCSRDSKAEEVNLSIEIEVWWQRTKMHFLLNAVVVDARNQQERKYQHRQDQQH